MNDMIIKTIEKHGYKVQTKVLPDSFGRYHGILTKNDGMKYFIKAVVGKSTYEHKSLLMESAITKYISELLTEDKVSISNYELKVPLVREVINEGEVLCFISEYIEGTNLTNENDNVQANILIKTIGLVNSLSEHCDLKQINYYLKQYSSNALLLRVPAKLVKSIILQPKFFWEFIRIAFITLRLPLLKKESSIIHADINASNIIVKNNLIYLYDWEQAGLGISDLNIIGPLAVHWPNTTIRNALLSYIINKDRVTPLLAHRTLELFNQKLDARDSRRIRDFELLKSLTGRKLNK